MRRPIVQFLSFPGCPLETKARAELEKALTECGLAQYEEIDVMAEETTEDMKRWGSPTILVDGLDVTGHQGGDEIGCRVYHGDKGVPDAESIADFLRRRIHNE